MCVLDDKFQDAHEKTNTNHNNERKRPHLESPFIAHERPSVPNGFEIETVSSITHVLYNTSDKGQFRNIVGNENIHCNILDLAKR